jgi:hypothetical protein
MPRAVRDDGKAAYRQAAPLDPLHREALQGPPSAPHSLPPTHSAVAPSGAAIMAPSLGAPLTPDRGGGSVTYPLLLWFCAAFSIEFMQAIRYAVPVFGRNWPGVPLPASPPPPLPGSVPGMIPSAGI